MPQNVSTDGDALERAFGEFIVNRLPGYARLWSAVIGNDGAARLPAVDEVPEALRDRRALTSQYAYTTLESVICAARLVDELARRLGDEHWARNGIHGYIQSISDYVAFYAHLGRARDGVRHLANTWQVDHLVPPLDEYFKQRNNVLHEARPPIIVIDAALAIVPPRGVEEDVRRWGKASRWTDADSFDYASITDHVKSTLDGAIQRIDSAFHELCSHLQQEAASMIKVVSALSPPMRDPSIVSASFGPTIIVNLPISGSGTA